MKQRIDLTTLFGIVAVAAVLNMPSVIFGQAKEESSYFKTQIGSKNKEIDLILKGIDVEHARYEFSDPKLKGALFRFRVKEFKNGKLVEEKDLSKNASEHALAKFTFDKSKDKYVIHSFARALDSKRLKLKLFFSEGFSYEPIYERPESKAKRQLPYSLREDFLPMDSKLNRTPIPLNKYFPFLVYSPPFDMGGGRFGFICSNPKFKKLPPEKWSSKADLPHVIVIELKVELPKAKAK